MESKKKFNKIAIMGVPVSSGNRGVMALANSLVHLCTKFNKNSEIAFLVGNKTSKPVKMRIIDREIRISVVNYRLSPRSDFRQHIFWIVFCSLIYRIFPVTSLRKVIVKSTPWIKYVSEATFVGDIRGGDSFSDIYGLKRFTIGFLAVWTVLLVKRNIVLFPQTYGPYKHPIAKSLARYILKKSSIIMARDSLSLQLAKNLAGPFTQGHFILCPDVAFEMHALIPTNLTIEPPDIKKVPTDFIGLNVNGLLYNGGYTRKNMFGLKLNYPVFLNDLVQSLLSIDDKEIILVPHTYAPSTNVESDNFACKLLRSELPSNIRHRVRLISSEHDPMELKGLIGSSTFFIGSRMHSCIAALSQAVPCVGVAYSRKFEGVFHSVGMSDWVIDARTDDNNKALQKIINLYRMRNDIQKDLAFNANIAHERLNEIFRNLICSYN